MLKIDFTHTCPGCGVIMDTPNTGTCNLCGFSINAMAGSPESDFQKEKWKKHTELLFSDTVTLNKGKYNASFDAKGVVNINRILRYTLTFGMDASLPSKNGQYENPVRIAFLPEIIGSGTAYHYVGNVPASGCCMISPASDTYSHAFPVLTEWVEKTFGETGHCRACERLTPFGMAFCESCYPEHASDYTGFFEL